MITYERHIKQLRLLLAMTCFFDSKLKIHLVSWIIQLGWITFHRFKNSFLRCGSLLSQTSSQRCSPMDPLSSSTQQMLKLLFQQKKYICILYLISQISFAISQSILLTIRMSGGLIFARQALLLFEHMCCVCYHSISLYCMWIRGFIDQYVWLLL